jgi:glycerol-3-phosphate dehydrogenase
MDGSKQGKRLHLTKGVHIVIDRSRLPLRQAVYFDTQDGRMVFAIPRDGKTYVGTTDTNYKGDIANPSVEPEDVRYLLDCANGMFPEARLTPGDVESGYAGLRPLIHEDGKSPSELSRRDEIFVSPSGLITIAGGKLTGYRKMAQRIVDLVASQLQAEGGPAYPGCSTDKVPLSGGRFDGGYEACMRELTERGQRVGLPAAAASTLAHRYGANTGSVLDRIDALRAEAATYGLAPDVIAALVYGIEEEMVARPLDFLCRRSSALFFDRPSAERWLEPVVRYMRDLFAWDEAAAACYADEARQALRHASCKSMAELKAI